WSNVMDTEDPNNYLEMCFLSRKSKKFFFFNPSDLAKPTDGATPSNPTRALNPLNPNDRNAAKVLLLTDVISFDVQVLKYRPDVDVGKLGDDFEDLKPQTAPFPWVFDTGLPDANDTYCIAALQISIRVWDKKTDQTRQITIIQDM